MWWKSIACLVPLVAASGCNIAYYAAKNAVNEPAGRIGQIKLRRELHREAEAAWERDGRAAVRGHCQAAYKDGFLDGFVDQAAEGGSPLPPVSAPARYRRSATDLSPEGQAAQAAYLNGFAHGAATAAAGDRHLARVAALAVPVAPPEQPLTITCVPRTDSTPRTIPEPVGPGVPPIPPAEVPNILPLPRGEKSPDTPVPGPSPSSPGGR